ncbi:replication protein, partial [Escherichia coli]|nr:replication protein [Escherichia coli]EHY5902283.1 replication protein [Escherichia coli]HAX8156023.1 replication protein [Escherichia coli]
PSGRPDATAIALLSEIVYWYRPTEVRDEHTGALLGYRKRFQGDKLQRSYQAFAEQFGFGKRETADALKRLRDAGFITLDLRTVEMLDGVKCSNILFVGINPQAIAAI